jgi:hypothetical protein
MRKGFFDQAMGIEDTKRVPKSSSCQIPRAKYLSRLLLITTGNFGYLVSPRMSNFS